MIRPRFGPEPRKPRLKKTVPRFRARRGVAEAGHSGFNRFRKIYPQDEKTRAGHEALHHSAVAIIRWRNIGVVYG